MVLNTGYRLLLTNKQIIIIVTDRMLPVRSRKSIKTFVNNVENHGMMYILVVSYD